MWPTLNVLGATLQTYPLAVLLAAGLGLWLAGRMAARLGMDGNRVHDLGFYALLATAAGARLGYVVAHWQAYKGALLSILSLTPTALSWPEGAFVGGVVAIIYARRHQLPIGLVLDAAAPGLALALAIERLGAFLSGEGLGEPTTMPWGIFSGDQVRHPVQLYEMTTLLIILAILLWQRERRPAGGGLFALFVALYAGSRLLLEAFHAQTPLLLGGVRAVQVVALGTLLAAVWYLYWRRFSGFDDAAVKEEKAPLVAAPD